MSFSNFAQIYTKHILLTLYNGKGQSVIRRKWKNGRRETRRPFHEVD